MFVGKISNDTCSILLKTIEEENETNVLNCFGTTKDNCIELEKNTLLIDSYCYDNWEGFNSPSEVDREQVVLVDGSIFTKSKTVQNKELNIMTKFCKCNCWNEKINCLFGDCCSDKITTFEFLNSCGKWLKVQIDLNGIEFEDFDNDCGYMNILAQENRQKYIEVSKEFLQYPTYTKNYQTIKICEDCDTDCYSLDLWNDTKKVCFDSSTSKIVFTPSENITTFTIIWNGTPLRVNASLSKGDVVEIYGGAIYINGVRFRYLSNLSNNFKNDTTFNGMDCVTIQTVEKTGSFGVIEYEKKLSCEYEIWGVM